MLILLPRPQNRHQDPPSTPPPSSQDITIPQHPICLNMSIPLPKLSFLLLLILPIQHLRHHQLQIQHPDGRSIYPSRPPPTTYPFR